MLYKVHHLSDDLLKKVVDVSNHYSSEPWTDLCMSSTSCTSFANLTFLKRVDRFNPSDVETCLHCTNHVIIIKQNINHFWRFAMKIYLYFGQIHVRQEIQWNKRTRCMYTHTHTHTHIYIYIYTSIYTYTSQLLE